MYSCLTKKKTLLIIICIFRTTRSGSSGDGTLIIGGEVCKILINFLFFIQSLFVKFFICHLLSFTVKPVLADPILSGHPLLSGHQFES